MDILKKINGLSENAESDFVVFVKYTHIISDMSARDKNISVARRGSDLEK